MNSFLLNPINPALLAGAALAAIPIILHLILRQKPKHLEFPPLRFLRKREHANTRRLRLRHWILLAMRVAAVCLLVFALARPRINASPGMLGNQKAPVAAAMVFDTSPRMDYLHHSERRLDAARQLALWLIGQMPQDSRVGVIDSRAGAAVLNPDLSLAKDQIDRLGITMTPIELSTSIEAGLQRLEEADPNLRRELYVFSDLSRAAWSPSVLRRVKSQLEDATGVAVYLIDVGVLEPRNFSVHDLQLSSELVTKNNPVTVRAEVKRIGPEEAQAAELWLRDSSGQPVKANSQAVKIAAGTSQTVEFRLPPLEEGLQQGYVSITGQDGLAWDDKQYFTVEVMPAWGVLLVADSPEKSIFLESALAPRELARQGRARFRCRQVSYEQLAESRLSDYAVVCLIDPPPMEPPAWNQLREYVQQGGSMACFLGRSAWRDVSSFNADAAQELLPGKLLESPGRAPGGTLYLAPNNFSHPMLADFRELEGKVYWNLFPVYRYWPLTEESRYRKVIAYNNGEPALLERRVGDGIVMTMTTSVSDKPVIVRNQPRPWNELVRDWPFMMLADQMMMYLAGSLEGRVNYQMGQTAHLPLASDIPPQTAFLIGKPEGQSQTIRRRPQDNELTVAAPDIASPGNYLVQGTVEGRLIKKGFSVNLPAGITQLDRVEKAQIEQALQGFPVQIARNKEEINLAVGKGRVGQEIFSLLALILALVLGGEYVLANRFYRTES